MPVASYMTVDGEVLAETRGGTDRDYLPDPLGSAVALLDAAQSKTDTFSFWPYGEERTRTGTTPTPFRFVGTLGYYRDDADRTYVRARSFRPGLARWQTLDRAWPYEKAYAYVDGKPPTEPDPSGFGGPSKGFKCGTKVPSIPPWLFFCRSLAEPIAKSEYCRDCRGLCNNWCEDNYADASDIAKCVDDCAKRAKKCRGKNAPFPPKY